MRMILKSMSTYCLFSLLAVILSCQSEAQKNLNSLEETDLIITEFMCSNAQSLPDQNENYSDWIELYNSSADTLHLKGYGLSNNENKAHKFEFEEGIMLPHEFKVLYASGKTEFENHVNFKLNKESGNLILTNRNREVVQTIHYAKQLKDISYSYLSSKWKYSTEPTPGKKNELAGVKDAIASPVQFSFEKKDGDIFVTLKSDQKGEIRYALDGSSVFNKPYKVYHKPFKVDSADVVKAALFSQNLITTGVNKGVYVNYKLHGLPVVSLITDPKNLWNDSTGIYVKGLFKNYEDRSDTCERPGHLNYFGLNEDRFSSEVNFKIYGSGTRSRPKKSMTIKPADGYMPNFLFSSNPENTLDGFVVRACYSDASRFKNEVVKGVNDMMNSELLMQEYQPAVLYLNGKYWGVFNIYERKNDTFIQAHHGEKVAHLLNANSRQAKAEIGSKDSYVLFLDSLNASDIKSKDAFEIIENNFHVGSLIDFWVHELYTLKADRFNNRFWKSKKGKWSFVGYDFDIGFVWPDNPRTKKNFLDKDAAGVEIFNKCIQNPSFAKLFFQRLADFMNFGYTEQNVHSILEKVDSLTREEFKRDYQRWANEWPKCLDKGDSQKKKIKSFIEPRSTYLRDSIAAMFGYGEQLSISNQVPDLALIYVNGYLLNSAAIYAVGMNVNIEVKPKDHRKNYFWSLNGKEVDLKSDFKCSEGGVLELKLKP